MTLRRGRKSAASAAVVALAVLLPCCIRPSEERPTAPQIPSGAAPSGAGVSSANGLPEQHYEWAPLVDDTCAGGTDGAPAASIPASRTECDGDAVASACDAPIIKVLETLRPQLASCYSAALNQGGRAPARVRLTLHVNCTGKVTSIRATAQGIDGLAVECLFAAVGLARFPAAKGGSGVINIPLVFYPYVPPANGPDGGS
jgi:hypothetical protein